ncbi:MAG: wax ester/triacylglycerol synthase family O-acyltransferase [Actinobacteria bacterium]|nr:MAG: wax ester/triacylglycerol synthase family O-acyltransferase [Actinomycetota bacterium]
MRQLTSLDAQFLALETARQSGHVAGLAILDPSTAPGGELQTADIQALIIDRLPQLPPLRWRLVDVPLGLDYPYWVDDPDFDLDFHVRELALPAPGSDQQLAEQVARIASRPLDRARPLWELYLIYGLPAGHVAMLTKIHHALIDGISGAEIMGLLLDLGPEGPKLPADPEWKGEADAPPTDREMLIRGLMGLPRYPLRMLRSLPAAMPNIDETPFSALPGAGALGRLAAGVQGLLGEGPRSPRSPLRAPKTSFNGRISPHRRFAFGSLPLAEVKAIKNEHGCTVNDVVVSICAGAVRRWLIEHDELPIQPLVAQIPVSVRSSEQVGTYGNQIMLMSAPLFTNEADPVKRLLRTHEALGDMKARHRALPAQLLQDANHFIPPAVFSRAARLTFRLSTSGAGRPTWNLVVSNVPGPQIPLYCAGAQLKANYPVSVITDGMGLNITVMSYLGNLDFGVVADRDQMPDLWKVIGWLAEAMEELRAGRAPGRAVGAPAASDGRKPRRTKAAASKPRRANPRAAKAAPKAAGPSSAAST